MSDVKWIKIATDIFDDDKVLLIESMPEADAIIVIWFKLLCMAGKQNNSGVFMLNDRIAYTDEMLATIFRRNINTVRLALSTFEKFGMIEIVNNTITIPNWGKHQKLDAIEARTKYQREYMRGYRAKQKLLAKGEGESEESNCKPNGNPKVSSPDKNKKKNKNINDEDARARARTCVREETTPEDVPNAFGDDDYRGDTDTVQQYAINNLQCMGARAIQECISFLDDLPESVVRHGIDNALDAGKRNWSYVRSILNSYAEEGVKTVGEAAEVDKRFKGKKYVAADARSAPRKTAAQESDEFWGKVQRL